MKAPRPRSQGDGHDYRECYYASTQPERRSQAAQDCSRFPCRVFREGAELGYQRGWQRGHDEGHAEGYAEGYPEGMAACPRPHGNG